MRVLITGASGFVGSFAVARFVGAGHDVLGIDRRPRPLDPRHGVGAPPVVPGDVGDAARVRAVADQHEADLIVHTAAIIGQGVGAADPVRMHAVNVGGTLAVLEAARARSARVVYLSTATLYGLHPDLHPLDEEARPDPVGLYDATKLMAETLVVTYHRVFGLDAVALRPGYVYGPDNSTGGYYLDRAVAGEDVDEPVGADLPQDVTYVRDLVEGIYLAGTVRPLEHRVFNITGGVLRRRREVVETVRRLVPTARLRVGPGIAPGAHVRGPSSLARAERELGYRPRFGLEEGMADWLEWLRR
jgi:nucleoside-diphosphate-sugar epimerase